MTTGQFSETIVFAGGPPRSPSLNLNSLLAIIQSHESLKREILESWSMKANGSHHFPALITSTLIYGVEVENCFSLFSSIRCNLSVLASNDYQNQPAITKSFSLFKLFL